MYDTNVKQHPTHPFTASDIVSLSFNGYMKNFLLHWFPFLIFGIIFYLFTPTIESTFFNSTINLEQELLKYEQTGVFSEELLAFYQEMLIYFIILFTIQGSFYSIPIAFSVLLAHKTFNNQPVNLGELVSEIIPKLPFIIILGGLVSLVSFLGIFIFGIGILFTFILSSVWFSVLIVILLFDDASFGALGKSKSLVSGYFMFTLGVLILMRLIQFVIELVIGLGVSSIIPDVETSLFISNLFSTIATPLTGVSIYFIYIDLKWRHANKSNLYGFYQGSSQPPQYPQTGYQQPPPQNQQHPPPQYQQQPPPPQYQQQQPPVSQVPKQQDVGTKKFCGSCGKSALNVDDKFCNYCGTKYQI